MSGAVDAYALFEALTGRKIDRTTLAISEPSTPSTTSFNGYEQEQEHGFIQVPQMASTGKLPRPDQPPKDFELNVGATNPYALVEAILGYRLDYSSPNVASLISSVLATDYDELFDMKHKSVLYAGLDYDEDKKQTYELQRQDINILHDWDFQTPDLSAVQTLADLEQVGISNVGATKIKTARLQNGKLHLVLDAGCITRTASNRNITRTVNEMVTRFRAQDERSFGCPPNTAWRDLEENVLKNVSQKLAHSLSQQLDLNSGRKDAASNAHAVVSSSHQLHQQPLFFDGPVQGATSNSWLIAALFSVYWSDIAIIHQCFRGDGLKRAADDPIRHVIKMYNKGGRRNNAEDRTLLVDYQVPIHKNMKEPVYCRSASRTDTWPSLYEKAYSMWIQRSDVDRADAAQTAYGDPVKAMAQIDGKRPQYFFTRSHSKVEILSIVRASSLQRKTVSPMCAYTHPTGSEFRGANMVANHAYSVLGWADYGARQYIVIRNPWGVTEPRGLSSYPGVIDRVDESIWPQASMLVAGGVLAVDVDVFGDYFACVGRTVV